MSVNDSRDNQSPCVAFVHADEHRGTRALTHAWLDRGARRVQAGDRVAIWAPNCWEWVVALLGLQSAGAVLVPLNTRYKALEAVDILRRSRARMLFTVEGFLGNDYVSMLDAAGRPESLERIVVVRDTGSRPNGASFLDELLADVIRIF